MEQLCAAGVSPRGRSYWVVRRRRQRGVRRWWGAGASCPVSLSQGCVHAVSEGPFEREQPVCVGRRPARNHAHVRGRGVGKIAHSRHVAWVTREDGDGTAYCYIVFSGEMQQ